MTPRIAVTPGDPAGIGPDIVCQLTAQPLPCELVVVADRALMESRAQQLGMTLDLPDFEDKRPRAAGLSLLHVPAEHPATPGQADPRQAGYILATLDTAVDGCRNGVFDALVTGPVNKSLINDAGIPFSGHTEYVATRCNAKPVMMLAGPSLRVALVTTHIPLSQVPDSLTVDRIEQTIHTVNRDLGRWFGLSRPTLLVTGLNPHAGENGHLGTEDAAVIEPAIARARADGVDVSGPIPGDTAFTPDRRAASDAVIAMYHDQGLAVVKALDFGKVVNITLGLPILRTSVDHGTAYDLAGRGMASAESLLEAIRVTTQMTQRQNSTAN